MAGGRRVKTTLASGASGKNRVTSGKRELAKRGPSGLSMPSGVGPVPNRQRETELRGLRGPTENGDLTLGRPDLCRFCAFPEPSWCSFAPGDTFLTSTPYRVMPTSYSDFLQRVRRHRPSDLLIALADTSIRLFGGLVTNVSPAANEPADHDG